MLYLCYLCQFKPLRDHLRGFLIAAWAGDKIAEFSFPEISFHFPLRPWFFFVSPAYAGKSSCLWWRKWPCRDHPRVCGEKQLQPGQPTALVGSSPHVRGKDDVLQPDVMNRRIIPACAGKSPFIGHMQHRGRDHPRMCGEKFLEVVQPIAQWGSSPHVRGKD